MPAIDDFGVGYSALSALKDYPLDELKIDASFVRNLVGTGHDAEIIRAIVALAQSLELTVVAEGVETEAQLDVLRAQRVLCVQGNLLGQAAPAREVEVLLRARARISSSHRGRRFSRRCKARFAGNGSVLGKQRNAAAAAQRRPNVEVILARALRRASRSRPASMASRDPTPPRARRREPITRIER